MVKIHFLKKVLNKWSSFRKKNKKNFSITGGGGGGSGPYMEFSIIIFYFFLNPSLTQIFIQYKLRVTSMVNSFMSKSKP